MIRRPHSFTGRLAAVGSFVAVLGAVGALIMPAALARHEAVEKEIEALGSRYAELVQRQRDLAALQQLRDSLLEADPQKFGLLPAETIELARAEIQRLVQDIAAGAGASILQLRAVETDQPNVASLAVDLSVPSESLPNFLLDVTNSDPFLFVDSIEIRADQSRRAGEASETLSVGVTLTSYVALPDEGGGG